MDITRTHYTATVKVIGFGGSGAGMIRQLLDSVPEGVDFILLHENDLSSLEILEDDTLAVKVDVGSQQSNGHARSEDAVPSGARRLEENKDDIRSALEDADMIILLAGGGDEPEVKAAPVIGKLAREMGTLVAGIITHRVAEEETLRSQEVEEGIRLFREHVDMLIVVSDDSLLPGFFTALKGS